MSASSSRQPAGTPSGGQFASTGHAEADVSLADRNRQFTLPGGHRVDDDDIVWADGDGDFELYGGSGNPGCDSCGVDDAVVKVEGRYLCSVHAGDLGLDVESNTLPDHLADSDAGKSSNPAYPNGRCDSCGQGLSDTGMCRDFECVAGPDEPDDQTLDQMRDNAGTTVIVGYEMLTSSEDLDRIREHDPDFPHEKWAAAIQNLRDVRDWLNADT